jgi:hypothetical protein
MGVQASSPLKEEAFTSTSNGLGRIVNLNCLFLSPLIRMNKNPIRT